MIARCLAPPRSERAICAGKESDLRERKRERRMPTITGARHVAFTVQDVDTSAAWYQTYPDAGGHAV